MKRGDCGEEAASRQAKRGFPAWIRARWPAAERLKPVVQVLDELGLHTVCQGAHCPNLGECFARGTATFMIMGAVCTRRCRFCAVRKGNPVPLEPEEPSNIAEAARRLSLKHVVVTSVTRDDLPDGGASHFAAVIHALRAVPRLTCEVLTPDFKGDESAVSAVAAAGPTVFNHNVETVPRLYAAVRPEADYRRSLDVLGCVKRRFPRVFVKSGMMLGMGETEAEVESVLADLLGAGCDAVTLGQYLSPSASHYPVQRFVEPEEFERLARAAERMGFKAVASGPLVRSSYMAERMAAALCEGNRVDRSAFS